MVTKYLQLEVKVNPRVKLTKKKLPKLKIIHIITKPLPRLLKDRFSLCGLHRKRRSEPKHFGSLCKRCEKLLMKTATDENRESLQAWINWAKQRGVLNQLNRQLQLWPKLGKGKSSSDYTIEFIDERWVTVPEKKAVGHP